MTHHSKVGFALCWHMHQPWYRQGIDGDYRLPWVYLHAIKDYADMAMHLEQHPGMQLVINFAPVLLEQLDDYASQLKGWLDHGHRLKDPMLNLLAGCTDIPSDTKARLQLLGDCQRANAEKMINPYPAYRQLLAPVRDLFPDEEGAAVKGFDILQYLDPQYFIDVLVWYHLAWLGYALKQTNTSRRLIKKAQMFDSNDRRELIELIHDCIAGLIPRYRALAEKGQIELSMTPYGHPIIPLLNDIENMSCAQPDAPRPVSDRYPGGVERSRWHMQKGIDCFEHYFGMRPTGVWLSEGAVSEDAIALIEEFDFKWTASGEGVWRNSMNLSNPESDDQHSKRSLFRPYQLKDYRPKIFFRDDGLSDLVGFEYSTWDSDQAASDLVQNLVNIADFLGKGAKRHVVSIILDGENAWEYYPHNGYHFLNHLYDELTDHKKIHCGKLSDFVDLPKPKHLKQLCAGSWVYGSFSTWIGEKDKNRAWDLLIAAKFAYDEVFAGNLLNEEEASQATRQLAICEGSDWFWWFGDHNPEDSVSDFDQLYRLQLHRLYQLLRLPSPDTLDEPLSTGSGQAENAGTMRRNVG